ncbi:MAG: NnrU family protein [Microvirga sp.]|nr:NnrU family protein [Microvirga sp.]
MTEFLLALSVFLLAHAIPPLPAIRRRLVQVLGKRAYLILYSALSLVLITWLVSAAIRAPRLPLWQPESWHAAIPVIIMPIALWLLIAGLAEASPLSVSIRATDAAAEPGPLAAVTRHPVLWGFLLWAVAHIPPTGHVVALILFAGMSLLAVVGMFALDRRARKRLGVNRWAMLTASAPLMPFAGASRGAIRWKLVAWPVATAILVYLWILFDGHRRFIGPDPLA